MVCLAGGDGGKRRPSLPKGPISRIARAASVGGPFFPIFGFPPFDCDTARLPRAGLDQRTNQAQEFLLLWAIANRDEKRSDLNVGDLAT